MFLCCDLLIDISGLGIRRKCRRNGRVGLVTCVVSGKVYPCSAYKLESTIDIQKLLIDVSNLVILYRYKVHYVCRSRSRKRTHYLESERDDTINKVLGIFTGIGDERGHITIWYADCCSVESLLVERCYLEPILIHKIKYATAILFDRLVLKVVVILGEILQLLPIGIHIGGVNTLCVYLKDDITILVGNQDIVRTIISYAQCLEVKIGSLESICINLEDYIAILIGDGERTTPIISNRVALQFVELPIARSIAQGTDDAFGRHITRYLE